MKFKNIKAIFIDLDGTLMNNKKEISFYTKEVIKKIVNKGIYVIITSGRTNKFSVEASKSCNASNIVISSNGSLVYDYKIDKIIFENKFSDKLIEKLWDLSKQMDVLCTYNGVFKRYKMNRIVNNNYVNDALIINSIEEIKEIITQVVISSPFYDKVLKVKEYLDKEDEIEISNTNIYNNISDNYFIDVTIKGANKGNGINKVLEYLNIDKKDTMCFGDQINDCSMFLKCNVKIAMRNGNDILKEKADYITKYSNDEDGVAKFLDEYIVCRK